MTTTWILVSNASTAKLWANHGPKKGIALLKEFEHPDSRRKTSELVSDRAGMASGNGHGVRQSHLLPKEHAALQFAHSLTRHLQQGRTHNEMGRLILVAPPAFMGMLNQNLDNATAQLVTDRLEKDYTKSSDADLCDHLSSCIYL